MDAISLFSGIGAFEYAATKFVFGGDWNILQFVEIEPTAQEVLRSHFPNVPIHDDIRTYHPPQLRGRSPSVVIGGFPCTNTSSAGNREGLDGSESGLWWEMYRVILEAEPDFVIIENPEGLESRGLEWVLGSLRMAGYQADVEMFAASDFGAPHQRRRIFIVAHSNALSLQQRQGWESWPQQAGTHIKAVRENFSRSKTQHQSCRVDDGIPVWMDGIYRSGWWQTNPPPAGIGVERGIKGRVAHMNFYGSSITIPQAMVALERLKFLAGLLKG